MHLLAVLLMSFVSVGMFYGTLQDWDEYSYWYLIGPLCFGALAITGWLDILFGRLIVDEEGIVQQRPEVIRKLPFFHDVLYAFENITEVKVIGNFAKIGYSTRFLSPSWVFVTKPEEFVGVVNRYIPEKVDSGEFKVRYTAYLVALVGVVGAIFWGVFPHVIEGEEYTTVADQVAEAQEFLNQYPSARKVVRETVVLREVEVHYVTNERGTYTPALTLTIKLDKDTKAVKSTSLECRYKKDGRVVHEESNEPLEWLRTRGCPGIERG